jgi:hypothetical protein
MTRTVIAVPLAAETLLSVRLLADWLGLEVEVARSR